MANCPYAWELTLPKPEQWLRNHITNRERYWELKDREDKHMHPWLINFPMSKNMAADKLDVLHAPLKYFTALRPFATLYQSED